MSLLFGSLASSVDMNRDILLNLIHMLMSFHRHVSFTGHTNEQTCPLSLDRHINKVECTHSTWKSFSLSQKLMEKEYLPSVTQGKYMCSHAKEVGRRKSNCRSLFV